MLDVQACIADNPFYVLELSPDCGRAEVEREGRKLLGMLELGLGQAATYPTPLGPQTRTADKVRVAMAQLVDPAARLQLELWARIPADASILEAGFDASIDAGGWNGARAALGWGR
jgi:hypothetical protein